MDTPQIKPSFFDEAPSADYIIWKKGDSVKKPSEQRLMEGILFKRSSGTDFWKSRYYVLFEDRLAYYKVLFVVSYSYPNTLIEQSRGTTRGLLSCPKYENRKDISTARQRREIWTETHP